MPNIKQLREMAKDLNMKNSAKLRKEELIHAIQLAEGNVDCFGKIPDCGHNDCLFYADCRSMKMMV